MGRQYITPGNREKYAFNDLGAHIKGRLKPSEKTQQDIGDVLKKSQQTVSRLLAKPQNITLGQMRQIISVVDLDTDVILKALGIGVKR